LLTGVGIGGMLAATNAATAEYGTRRHHDLAVAMMAGGYPLGAVVGGALATHLLVGHGWRWVFGLGAVLSAGFVPVVWQLVPETPAFLWRRRPKGALAGLNRWLVPLGHGALAGLPDPVGEGPRGSFGLLFGPALRRTTACITLAYVAQIMTFYFILKWTPKIVADLGFAPATAGGVLVWANIGGLAGSVALSLLTRVAPVRALTIGGMVLSVVLVAAFGRVGADLPQLKLLAAVAGVFTNAGMVGLYAIVAARFPAEARGSGTGFVIGVGRAGAALSPMLAGWLFRAGEPLPVVALLMASGSAVAVVSLLALGRPRTGWPATEGAR
jgi:MFS family permease